MAKKTIYDLKLHAELEIRENLKVMRVPGGWVYTQTLSKYLGQGAGGVCSSSVFVPFITDGENLNTLPN